MSENTTPITPFFELQRETISQTVRLLSGPRQVRKSLTNDGAAAGMSAQTQALELFRQAVRQTVGVTDAVAPTGVGGESLQTRVDDLFEEVVDHQTGALESLEELRQEADERAGARTVAQLALLMQINESIERQVATTAAQCERRVLDDDVGTDLEAAIEEVSEALESSLRRLETLESDLGEEVVEIPIDDGSDAEAEETPDAAPEEGESVPADEVRCRVCGERFGAITYSHLQTHEMTVEEYTTEFGDDVPLRPDEK